VTEPLPPTAHGWSDSRVAELEAIVARLEASSATLAEMVHRAERFAPPALWNDTRQPLAPPVGTIGDLLAGGASIDDELARFPDDPVLERVRAWGLDTVRQYAATDMQLIPAATDRVGYYANDDIAYWLSGIGDWLQVADIARELERPLKTNARFLDFGCATGRVLRHLAGLQPDVDAVGVDLGRQHVAWCREHLEAPVLHGTALPTLPFADASVDVIYAGSVFTHIDDFEEAWLAELRRVLAPNGFALVTIASDSYWNGMRANPAHALRRRMIDAVEFRLRPGGVRVTDSTFDAEMPAQRVVIDAVDWPDTTVFHSHAWIRERWARMWRIARIIERSYGGQDSVVLLPHAPSDARTSISRL
jgi:SAM-dependent methyltransferase